MPSIPPRACGPLAALALLTVPVLAQDAAAYGGDPTLPAPFPPKPEITLVDADHEAQVVQLKFEHGSDVRLRDGVFVGSADELGAVNSALVAAGGTARRMFQQSEDWLAGYRLSGEARTGIVLHDLNLLFRVEVASREVVGALCDALNAFDVVTLAWPAPTGGDPTLPAPLGPPAPAAPLALGGTPNFEKLQGYKLPAPTGIDALYGNTFSGGRGIGTTIVDVETGWTDTHEDLINKIQGEFVGWIPASNPWDHGTAVLGELIGEDNGLGVRGIVWEADAKMSTHSPVGGGLDIPGAVANAAAVAAPGDAMVLEVQCYGAAPDPFPCEFDPAVFATVQAVTANGVHVFAAAGNGSHDLDQPAYGGAFDLAVRDSGAVLVGATNGSLLVTAGFSNYGSRITSNGWGEDVTTCGYGDLFDGGPASLEYTDTFSGTSSATPIVTGAGVALNAIHREAFGSDVDPLVLRDVLAATGTPQTGGGAIGTRPDLRAAVRQLGIPEIAVGGDLVEGGLVEVTSHGAPGDLYGLFWSPNLGAPWIHLAPFGYFYLDVGLLDPLSVAGTIGAGGTSLDPYGIPTGLGLSGVTSYLQGIHVFVSQPGNGSFTNYASFRIQ